MKSYQIELRQEQQVLYFLDEVISRYNISDDILREYYYEVVLPMKYDNNVMKVINKKFSLYLPDIESGKGKQIVNLQ